MDERARYRMQRRIAEVVDEETAVTLMAHLPPGGWADVATKSDVVRLEQKIDRQLRVFIATTVTSLFAAVLATAGIVATVGGGL